MEQKTAAAIAKAYSLDRAPCRVWHWRQNRSARLAQMEARGLRTCIRCGRQIGPDRRADAIYCGKSCKVLACQSRRRVGISVAADAPRRPRPGDRRSRRCEGFEEWLDHFEHDREVRFSQSHFETSGRALRIGRMPQVCPRYRQEGEA